MAWTDDTYDLAVLKRAIDHLEAGGGLAWVPTTELPAWALAGASVVMGTVHLEGGPAQILDGPWFGLRVVQLVQGPGGRRWRFATLRLPMPGRPMVRSLAHRLACREDRFPVHGRRQRRRSQRLQAQAV